MDTSKIVGEKIKALREDKSISIEELAQRSGLAIEQVERIENNIDIPSLAPLIKIARVLGVRLGTFLDDQDEVGPVVCRKKEAKDAISFSNNAIHSRKHMEYHSLSKSKADRHMEPFIIDVMPTEDTDFVLSSHEGEEFIMVMEGIMEISYGKMHMNDDISIWADPRALIYGVTFLPMLGLGLMLISLIFTRSKNNLSGRQLLVFSAFPITQMVCEASFLTLVFTPPRYEYIPMQLIMSVLFLVSDILLYRTMVRTEQRVQLEVENALLESQLDAQLAHYRDLTAQYEQIRAMRHDIAHHLNTIHALLEAGNLQAASEYSEQLLPAQTYSSRLGACRNPVVDAFLYTRVQDAQARGVPVRADVSLPVELPVSNTDLIVAFGNLLDNALEACSGIPDAQITLRAHMDKGYLVIQESNPVRARQPQGKKPRRIPELERGVGFRVLSGLAAKYDGSFRHTCENDTYTVTLLLSAGAVPVS